MDSVWQNIVTALEVDPAVADQWLAKLKQQYGQPGRHYHNEQQMLAKKLEHLAGASVCLQLATLFQYFHFDAGRDCAAENCDALKEFLASASVDNVRKGGALYRETIDKALFSFCVLFQKALINNVLRLLGDATVESSDLPDDDVAFFQDLDLLILG